MSTAEAIAVTGATGGLGGGWRGGWPGAGVAQRLVVRDPARAPELAGAEVVPGSYDDGEGLRRPPRTAPSPSGATTGTPRRTSGPAGCAAGRSTAG